MINRMQGDEQNALLFFIRSCNLQHGIKILLVYAYQRLVIDVILKPQWRFSNADQYYKWNHLRRQEIHTELFIEGQQTYRPKMICSSR